MASVNMSIRIDSELKAQAEEILEQLGLNMNGTINMLLRSIQKASRSTISKLPSRQGTATS